jgi:sulfopyruvate decarboxylase subunit alpha
VSQSGVSARSALAALHGIATTHVLAIPDSENRHLYAALDEDPDIELITPSREGESLAIAAGLWTGGCRPLVLIQNTGLMEAGDALRGCGIGPRIPLRLMVGWRGYPGAKAGRLPIDSAYPFTEPLLQAWEVPYSLMMSDDDLGAVAEMDQTAEKSSHPAAVLFGNAFRP